MTLRRICILGSAASVHIQKWTELLVANDFHILLLSAHTSEYKFDPRITVCFLPFLPPMGYVLNIFAVRKNISRFAPDVVNVHYATGYGLLARLSGVKPSLLSVWGSDVFEFPKKSAVHKFLLRFNLKGASSVASTSKCMANEIMVYSPDSDISITPFGIDVVKFEPKKTFYADDKFVIGTVKALEHKYGIDILINAFYILLKRYSGKRRLELHIYGSGKDELKLVKLIQKLKLTERVTLFGKVPNSHVPEVLSTFNVFGALSREESFGVAVLEALSCKIPVVVSSAPGLSEIISHYETGLIVDIDNPNDTANAFMLLIENAHLREKMSILGRDHVIKNYSEAVAFKCMVAALERASSKEIS